MQCLAVFRFIQCALVCIFLVLLSVDGSSVVDRKQKFTLTQQEEASYYCDASKKTTKSRRRLYRVGVLGIRGAEIAVLEYNTTFSTYLTATAGQLFDPPLQFEMVPVTFTAFRDPIDAFQDNVNNAFDFIFTNPNEFSCLQTEAGASAMVTQISQRTVDDQTYNLTEFGGVIFTLAERSTDITTLADLRNKRIGTVSLSGLGSGQMQFRELIANGVHHLADTRQMIFYQKQGRVVQAVLNGEVDVGFVRTDQLERSVDPETGNKLNLSQFQLLNVQQNKVDDDDDEDETPFPFQASTRLYPEWSLASMPHVSDAVTKAVQMSLLNMADHAAVSPSLLACYDAKTNDNDKNNNVDCYANSTCRQDCWESLDPSIFRRCDTTLDLAHLAHTAMLSGKHAGFRMAMDNMQLRNLQQETGFLIQKQQKQQQPNGASQFQCIRSATSIADTVTCPDGYLKKTDEQIANSCVTEGLDCFGFYCICSPCIQPLCDQQQSIQIGSNCIPYKVFFPAIVIPSILIPTLVVICYMEMKRRQANSTWHVDRTDLIYFDTTAAEEFNNPDASPTTPTILGRGTFGLVLQAEYQGTKVAVKRVLPKNNTENGTKKSTTDAEDKLFAMEQASLMTRKQKLYDTSNHRTSNSGIAMEAMIMRRMQDTRTNTSNNEAQSPSQDVLDSSKLKILFNNNNNGNATKPDYARRKKMFLEEMATLSKLRHPCITGIIGAAVSPKNADPLLIMEYMELGSLYDVLHNELRMLSSETMETIVLDVARGLRFLHAVNPPIIHGDLKSRNVLVDSKLRAKITNYGWCNKKQYFGPHNLAGTPYWMAPELLRGETGNTAKSDIYSFGILLGEVFSRKDPYEGEDEVTVLREVADDSICKRPPIPDSCPREIASLMKSCLSAKPADRPVAKDIDLCLTMADSRTDQLLWQLFPKHVAAALREGRKVEPESHPDVTIFFSDIVGYTEISSTLSPHKVSNLLDRLYTKLDHLSDVHHVFKVETIGDAYMAVTNLATPQPDHVERMARFALDVITAASETLIDEDDPTRGYVQVRAGIHRGPVVSHVVGSSTPRYSLIGDTVNTASRMESTSIAGRVHCSEDCAKSIEGSRDLSVESRGEIEVKGKGLMTTYWVDHWGKGTYSTLSNKVNALTETSGESSGSSD